MINLPSVKKYGIVNIAAIVFGTFLFVWSIQGAMELLDSANGLAEYLKNANKLSVGLVVDGLKIALFTQMILGFPIYFLVLVLSIIGIRKKGQYAFLSKIALWETIIGTLIVIIPIIYFFICFFQL